MTEKTKSLIATILVASEIAVLWSDSRVIKHDHNALAVAKKNILELNKDASASEIIRCSTNVITAANDLNSDKKVMALDGLFCMAANYVISTVLK